MKLKNEFKTLLIKKEDGVAIVTLNNPQRLQAINLDMARDLRDCMEQCRDDDEVRAVLLNSHGRAFCSGYEISGAETPPPDIPHRAKYIVDRVNEGFFAITDLEKPVVCAVQGFAVGGGVALTMACDIVIAADTARFRFVYTYRGLCCDAGPTYWLPRLVGLRKAKELMFLADFIDAHEAERIGLINKVVPEDKLEEESMACAKRLAAGATIAIGITKTLTHRGLHMDMRTAMGYEPWGQEMCSRTEDGPEGVRAFFEKRVPEFKGR